VSDGRQPSERPIKSQIMGQLVLHGIPESQVRFSVDEDVVDNVDVYRGDMEIEQYRAKVQRLIAYAANSGAAMGFHDLATVSDATPPLAKPFFLRKIFGSKP